MRGPEVCQGTPRTLRQDSTSGRMGREEERRTAGFGRKGIRRIHYGRSESRLSTALAKIQHSGSGSARPLEPARRFEAAGAQGPVNSAVCREREGGNGRCITLLLPVAASLEGWLQAHLVSIARPINAKSKRYRRCIHNAVSNPNPRRSARRDHATCKGHRTALQTNSLGRMPSAASPASIA
jgi:hypothetical protein